MCVFLWGREREREKYYIYIDRKKEKGTKERVSKGENPTGQLGHNMF